MSVNVQSTKVGVRNGWRETDVPRIGVDIVDLARIEQVVRRWGPRFEERVLGENEAKWCRGNYTAVAACFAVKEAAIKAIGFRPRGFRWSRFELLEEADATPADPNGAAIAKALTREAAGNPVHCGRWAFDMAQMGPAIWAQNGHCLIAVAAFDNIIGQ